MCSAVNRLVTHLTTRVREEDQTIWMVMHCEWLIIMTTKITLKVERRREWRHVNRVFGPSLANTISSEWSYRPNHNTVASTVAPFIHDIVQVSIHDLVDHIGAKVDPRERKRIRSWFPLVLAFMPKQCEGKIHKAMIGSVEFKRSKAWLIRFQSREWREEVRFPPSSQNAAIVARKYSSQSVQALQRWSKSG